MTTVDFVVSFKSQSIPFIAWKSESAILDVKNHLETAVGVPVFAQKLLWKGKMLKDDQSLDSINLSKNGKILLMGSTLEQLEGIEKISQKIAARQKTALRPVKPSKAIQPTEDLKYTFHNITVLSEFHQSEQARKLLERLRDDRGIKAIMKQRKWSVGELTELTPFETSILGYNRNAGQLIAIRLRTDDLTGFRYYDSIRKVLLHELTHNVWSEHDDNFHALNRQLNKDVVKLDWTAHGGHRLGGNQQYATFQSSGSEAKETWKGGTYRLGGNSTVSSSLSAEERRELVLKAAMSRLTKKEEKEMDEGCASRKQ